MAKSGHLEFLNNDGSYDKGYPATQAALVEGLGDAIKTKVDEHNNSVAHAAGIAGNADTATRLETARTIALTGGAVGAATAFDGTQNITIVVTAISADKIIGELPYLPLKGTAEKAIADIDGVKLVGIHDSAAAHNALFRGKDLTNYFNSGEMSKAIANGSFEDIFIGDYINKNITVDGVDYTVKWEVAHLDYFLYSGNTECTTHHVLLFPSKTIQTNVPMNDTNTAAGGYVATKMWTETIPKYVTGITNAFGSAHVLAHKELLTKAINADAPSGAGAGGMGSSTEWDWYDTLVNIPSEPMIYGGLVCGSSAYDVGNKERQLQIFQFKKFNEGRLWYWLQAVASASSFAFADDTGCASDLDASYSNSSGGIRPYFLLY